MSNQFTIGVVVGGLAALTPFLTPAVIVVGLWALYCYGLDVPSDTATGGVLWVSAWTALLTCVLVAVVLFTLGLWGAPKATLTAAGTLLVLATVRRRMYFRGGGGDGAV